VGKCIGEWVYEIFITTLSTEGFLAEDVLDLYHGRGAFEAVLADEDVEEDPDRWCSYTECGQELWQIACQWVWNLRLALGQQMQAGTLRDTLVGSCERSPSSVRGCGKRTGRVRPVAVGESVRRGNGTLRS